MGRLNSDLKKGTHSVDALRNTIKKLQQERDLLPASAEKQIRDINSAVNKLNNELQRMETINGSKVKTWFKDAFDSIPSILKNPVVLAGGGVIAAFNEGLKNSRERLDFKMLLGDNAGAQVYSEVKRLQPILGDSVQQVSKDLLGVGVASDKVLPMLQQLGAVSGGNQEKFNALSGAFADMRREGRLTENGLETMNSAGIRPLTIISEKYGVKMSKLQQMLADGKIGFDMINEALGDATGKGGEFAGVLEKLSDEPSVKLSILAGKARDAGGAFGDLLVPVLSKGLDLLMGMADWGEKNKTMLKLLGGMVMVPPWLWMSAYSSACLSPSRSGAM